jgi:hypothetical protein
MLCTDTKEMEGERFSMASYVRLWVAHRHSNDLGLEQPHFRLRGIKAAKPELDLFECSAARVACIYHQTHQKVAQRCSSGTRLARFSADELLPGNCQKAELRTVLQILPKATSGISC